MTSKAVKAVPPKRRGGREPRHDVDAVLGAALELIDAEGLQAFSMRRLADKMGIGPMTIYGYVRTREDVLDGVVSMALHGILDDLDHDAPWDERVMAAISNLREAMRNHPGVLELLLAKPAPSHQLDLIREMLLRVMRDAGFEGATAWESVGMLASYAIGFIASEISFGRPGSPHEHAERLKNLPARDYPNLIELADHYPAHMSDRSFERGLQHLLSGLRLELAQDALKAPRSRKRLGDKARKKNS